MEGAPKAADKLNLVNIVTIGVVGALLVWVSVVALQAYYKNSLDQAEHDRMVENQDIELREVQSRQQEKLGTWAMRDDLLRKKKVVIVPADHAMKLVIEDLTRNPAASTVPDVGAHDQPTQEAEPPYNAIRKPAPAPTPAPAPEPAPEGDGAAPAAPEGGAAPAAPEGGAAPTPGGDANP